MSESNADDRDTPARRVAEKFGGINALGRALDPPRAPSTVFRWIQSGRIPAQHMPAVLAAAKRKRIDIKPGDLIPE